MVVYLIGQAGLADDVATGQLFQNEALAVRINQSCPDDLRALLPEGDTAVIGPEQQAALRDQEIAAGRAVIDVLRDMPHDLAWQVRTDFRVQHPSDRRASLKDIGRRERRNTVRADRRTIRLTSR